MAHVASMRATGARFNPESPLVFPSLRPTLCHGDAMTRTIGITKVAMRSVRRTWSSFDDMQAAAKEGDPQAQCYLGICYQTGQNIAPDHQEAVRWFRKAAEQNDPVAQCYLGFCYQAGQGIPQEFGQAARWFREAA